MFVEERHQEILRLLEENEKVKVKDLKSKRFEVTEDCIRKDSGKYGGKEPFRQKEHMVERFALIHCIQDIIILYRQEKIRI